jgi:hypothetical protein
VIRNPNTALAIGMISLVLGILLGRYAPSTSLFDFMEGLFYGLSLVLNTFTLVLLGKQRGQNHG